MYTVLTCTTCRRIHFRFSSDGHTDCRHHRYVFEEREKKQQKSVVARLQELGPRFTLRLRSLQKGTFDSKAGEYEWIRKPDQDTSRRKFFL